MAKNEYRTDARERKDRERKRPDEDTKREKESRKREDKREKVQDKRSHRHGLHVLPHPSKVVPCSTYTFTTCMTHPID